MPTTQRHYPDVPAEATCGFGMDPRTLMIRLIAQGGGGYLLSMVACLGRAMPKLAFLRH